MTKSIKPFLLCTQIGIQHKYINVLDEGLYMFSSQHCVKICLEIFSRWIKQNLSINQNMLS